MKNILERFKSPVIVAVILMEIYTFVEVTDFTNARMIVLGVISILIATFGAINNPTDRDKL